MKDAEMVAFPEEGEHIRELGVRGKVRGENVDEYYTDMGLILCIQYLYSIIDKAMGSRQKY